MPGIWDGIGQGTENGGRLKRGKKTHWIQVLPGMISQKELSSGRLMKIGKGLTTGPCAEKGLFSHTRALFLDGKVWFILIGFAPSPR